MSGTGTAGSLDLGVPWHQRAVRTSRSLVQTHFHLPSSVLPPPAAGRTARAPLRLPSLVSAPKGPHRKSSMARLSLSEPSLFTPNANVPLEGFSGSRGLSVLQKQRPPPPPPPPPPYSKSSVPFPCKSCHPSGTGPTQNKTAFIHFSQPIQPSSKPRRARPQTHKTHQIDLRPPRDPSSQGEPLSVVGTPCFPNCSQRSAMGAAVGPSRPQLHVFLPMEAAGEEGDSESVDEGFMEELDSVITSLKLQHGAPKIHTYN